MHQTLVDLLRGVSHLDKQGYTFLDGQLNPKEWSFAQLWQEAERRARCFKAMGLKPGDRLAMVVPEGEDFVLSFFGAVRAGVVPVPMYPPLALGKLDSYMESARRVLKTAGAKVLLTSKQVSPILWSLLGNGVDEIVLTEKLASMAAPASPLPEVTPDQVCFLQFTSGSTSDPKGVEVTHANLVANARAIMVDGLSSNGSTDRGVSWLPLYHDMGLIGFVIAPLWTGVPVVFIPTLSFVKRPTVWMETVHKYRGTITFAPNFAFGLAARRANARTLEGLDLSCLRVLGCGAEPINAKTMHQFVEAFAPAGFDPRALMPCYGMAEATLAISFDRLDQPITSVTIDRGAYEAERVAKPAAEGLELVSVGRTFPHHALAIRDDHGQIRSDDGVVGEILVRGPSITRGYFENHSATEALLADGWLHTGDLGFFLDGALFISGRKKDLIILNGRNYYPQTIEWEVEHVEGIRRGNVVAFSVRGDNSEELVIVAECKLDAAEERATLSEAVKRHVQVALGLAAKEVVLVGQGALPKTSSGKLQRKRTKALFESGDLAREGDRRLGSTATKVALARHVTKSAFVRLRHTLTTAPSRLFAAWRRNEATANR